MLVETEEDYARVRAMLLEGVPLNGSLFNTSGMREALEMMRIKGEACIHHRENKRRFFTHMSFVMPDLALPPAMEVPEYQQAMVERRLGCVGFLLGGRSDAYIGIAGMDAAKRDAAFDALLSGGRLREMRIEGFDAPVYARAASLEYFGAFDAPDVPKRAAFLGPLDNMLWDRKLIERLFGFYYRWEVYTPQEKRTYAAYTLPVLYGDQFIGRVALKRADNKLCIENLWLEDGVRETKAMRAAIAVRSRRTPGCLVWMKDASRLFQPGRRERKDVSARIVQ